MDLKFTNTNYKQKYISVHRHLINHIVYVFLTYINVYFNL